MQITKLKATSLTIVLFCISLLICSAPRVVPVIFSATSGADAIILGKMNAFFVSEATSSTLKTAHYIIPISEDLSGKSLTIPPIFYSYKIQCYPRLDRPLSENSSPTLERNLNKYLVISSVPASCKKIDLQISGPANSKRLTTGDGYVLAGDTTRLEDLRWLLEFFGEVLPLLLALIFISIVFLYQVSGIRHERVGKSNLVAPALWTTAFFFVNQTGLFVRALPFTVSDTLNSKIGVGLAILSLILWVFVSFNNRKTRFFLKYKNIRSIYFVLASLIGTILITTSQNHRSALVVLCCSLGTYLAVSGLRKKSYAQALLGICLLLDSVKIFGWETPFNSRTSWYFLSELLILDSVIRQFSYSRTQWLLHRFGNEISFGDSNLSDSLEKFRAIISEAFMFREITAQVLSGDQTLVTDLRTTTQIIVQVGEEKSILIRLGGSFYFDLDVPAAKLGLESLTNELENKLPAIFFRVLDEQTRKFDLIVDALTSEFKGREDDQSIEQFLTKFSNFTDTRILFADYFPETHQIKPRFVANYPDNIKERFLEGYLRALPENAFSPLSRGIHSDRVYSCPDIKVLKPFLHENTAQFYEQTKTLSCFSFNLRMSVNGGEVKVLIYVESSVVRFDEHFKYAIEKLKHSLDGLLKTTDLTDQLNKATTALSRFIPRNHVFALMSGVSIVEKDRGYLLMIDLKGSTKFSLAHGSDAWLARVELLQNIIRPIIESNGMVLQTFSWDAAFITKTSSSPSLNYRQLFEDVSRDLGRSIEAWACADELLSSFWSPTDQKARFCITYGDISRGLAVGTTETWTVTGEAMAVVAKMEAECKKLEGILFTDDDPIEINLRTQYRGSGCKIRGVDREVLIKYTSWLEFISESKASNAA